MKFYAIAVTFFFFILSTTTAQEVEITDGCKEAYHQIISLRFNHARQILSEEKEHNSENLFVPYLENYIDFLTVFISEDEEQFDWLEDNKSQRINRIKKLSDTSRYKNYMLGNIHLQWAVSRLKFKEYFTAAFEINKAYRLLEKNAENFPEFVPNNISLGVLHVMIGMVPNKYHWLLNLISMEGSVEQGRAELEFVIQQSSTHEVYAYLKNETLFYLGFIDLNINPDPVQIASLLTELEKEKNNNLLLSYLTANILMRTGRNDNALEILNDSKNIEGAFPFFFLDYLAGECYLRKLEFTAARESYNLFLKNFKGKNYIGDAYRKIAWTQLINNDSTAYKVYMQKVIELSNKDVDIDKEAFKEASTGVIPNIELIKSRLLFDGGYYTKADSLLQNIDSASLNAIQTVEREYRLARVSHKHGNMEKAKGYYEETIIMGSSYKKYYAGNSALQLGEIYESEGEKQRAVFYYRLCLGLDFDEYENSIHSKAKAGLERLED